MDKLPTRNGVRCIWYTSCVIKIIKWNYWDMYTEHERITYRSRNYDWATRRVSKINLNFSILKELILSVYEILVQVFQRKHLFTELHFLWHNKAHTDKNHTHVTFFCINKSTLPFSWWTELKSGITGVI